ncbi:Predicted membrane protein [Anaerotruncus sp. 2789STDY5834896]|uniref:Predicted membrane protein n=1 Tax=uncultured Anaerotruncus sp. TaxID=905011 RepID=A0A1C6GEI1_9FIRM|nr:Predicted membrane protein [uncultured Anaerotruncus sp.]
MQASSAPIDGQPQQKAAAARRHPGAPSLYQLFWIFVIASILGYVVEMLFYFVRHGSFESRQGLLYGPFSQIYGLGAAALSAILGRFERCHNLVIFGVSAVFGAVFEFVCSLVQELVFGSVSWDYTGSPLNLGGRTNIKYAIFWGLLGLVFLRAIYPWFCDLIRHIPTRWAVPLTSVVAIFLAVDMVLSAAAVWRSGQRRQGVAPEGGFAVFLDQTYPDDYLKEVYPNMKFI